MATPRRCLIGIGSNLGDRESSIDAAVARLAGHREIGAARVARPVLSRPVGGPSGQPSYLNTAASFETALSPRDLLALLHEVEAELGRTRATRWEARTIDLDLLLCGDAIVCDDALVLPHPRMCFRRFVLTPAAEVAADMTHPAIGWTVAQLLAHLDAAPNYVAVAGGAAAARREIVRRAAESSGWLPLHDPPRGEPAARMSLLREASKAGWCDRVGAVSDFWLGEDEDLPAPKLLIRIAASGEETCLGQPYLLAPADIAAATEEIAAAIAAMSPESIDVG